MPHEWTPVVFPEDTDRPEVDVQGRILGPFDSPILHSGETGSHQVEMTNHERRAVTFDIEGTHDDPRLEYGEPHRDSQRGRSATTARVACRLFLDRACPARPR